MKRQKCKRHVAIDTCLKQTEPTIFLHVIFLTWPSQEPIFRSRLKFGYRTMKKGQMLIKFASEVAFLIGNAYRSYCITCAVIRFMLWFVWNQLPRGGVEA